MAEPRHFSIVVIDIEGSGGLDGPQKVLVRKDLYEILDAALKASGIAPDAAICEDRGDGVYLLVDSAYSIRRLIHPFIATIDAALADRRVGQPKLRLRLVVHQGAVTRDRQGSSSGAVDVAFAMVDAPQLRDALKQSPTGRLAVVIPDEVYQDVVRGHDEPDPTAFRMRLLDTKHGRQLRTFVTVTGAMDQPAAHREAVVPEKQAAAPGSMFVGDQWEIGTVDSSVIGGSHGSVTLDNRHRAGEH